MSEVSDMLQQKAGLSPEQAQMVEQLVSEHLLSRVPPEFQGILGSLIGSGATGQAAASSGGLGGLLDEASSLFGGLKG
jgi:uncharacterized protein YidB (DUF937 family)